MATVGRLALGSLAGVYMDIEGDPDVGVAEPLADLLDRLAALQRQGGVVKLVMAMLSVGLFLAFVRLVRGPSLPDRMVALDLTATLVVGIIVVYDLATHQPVLLDVALVGFLGAVAFAYYVERGVTS